MGKDLWLIVPYLRSRFPCPPLHAHLLGTLPALRLLKSRSIFPKLGLSVKTLSVVRSISSASRIIMFYVKFYIPNFFTKCLQYASMLDESTSPRICHETATAVAGSGRNKMIFNPRWSPSITNVSVHLILGLQRFERQIGARRSNGLES